jgi:alkylation response protein AidB-like acyl-CoA dehydrogenase
MAEKFAGRELEEKAIELDDYPFAEFNQAALDAAKETGMLTVTLPEDHGGVGQGMAVLCEMLEALARADGSFAAVVFVNALAQAALVKWGAASVIEKYAGSGLMAFPVYDLPTDLPGDLAAEKKGEGYALKGKVDFLPLAPVADTLIVPAKLGDKTALVIVGAKAEGVKVGEPLMSLGLRNCPVADVEIKGVEVPADHLLSADAEADYPTLAAAFRPAAAAMAVGVLEGSYEGAKSYAKERYQGGSMIIDYDMVRLMLVNMAVVAESGKALVRTMAEAADGERPWPISDAGLILLTEQASRATTDGVQCLGGYGYMQDYGQEKRMRDSKQIELIFGSAPAKRLELMADILRQEE